MFRRGFRLFNSNQNAKAVIMTSIVARFTNVASSSTSFDE